jgi:hypothetical protein
MAHFRKFVVRLSAGYRNVRALTALLTLPVLSAIGYPVCLSAQAGKIAASEQPDVQAGSGDGKSEPADIVVTGRRYGEAKVAAENEFDENQIAAQGADSIQDLLTRLAPFIGKGGEAPVILINGRPAGFDQSVLVYPAEALSRLAVLKPEAAARYGAPAGKRVVNLVLKQKFSSLTADTGVNWATRGGQRGGALSVGRTAISGDTRWNVQVRLARDSALLKSVRTIPRPAGVFDGVGYVSGLDGGEIDHALSDAVGQVVTVAAIPPRAGSGPPAIGDFVATANKSHAVDPNAFDTLLPSRQTIALNAGVTRPLGEFFLSFDLNANSSRVRGLRGLPMASFVIPAGSPWSLFDEDVLVTRPFAGARALRNDNDARSIGGSLSLTGATGGWQTSVALSYLRSWNDNVLESGIDIARIRQLVDAGDPGFNPYGPWDKSLMLVTRSRSSGNNLGARLNIQKKMADLPAGPLAWSLVADASRAGIDSRQTGNTGTAPTRTDVTFSQANGQMSLAIPLGRRGRAGLGRLGDLSVDLWIGGQAMTRTSSQSRFGGGLNWSPIRTVQLNGIFEHAGTAPSFDQRDAPLVRTVNRVFDYTRQEVAEPVWTMGGNPDLQRGSRRTISLSAMAQPLGDQSLSLNMNYRQTVANGGSAGFPELSPAIEAAFPERVTRDASGQLIAIDARPINILRDTDADLFSTIALRFSGAGHGAAGQSAMPGDPIQFTLSLNHRWRLKSEMVIRPGVPAIDRLGGGTGASRHSLNLQLGAGKRGIGASLNAAWSSPARIDEGTSNEALQIRPPTIFNVSAFVDPDQLFPQLKDRAMAKNLNISVSVDNILNGYSRVMRADGSVPVGFSHDEVDPLGRTVRLTVRKRF